MSEYRWAKAHEGRPRNDSYEVLLCPDSSELAMLTEPEDRCSYLDLAPIVEELNRLAARVTDAEWRLNEAGDPDDQMDLGTWRDWRKRRDAFLRGVKP